MPVFDQALAKNVLTALLLLMMRGIFFNFCRIIVCKPKKERKLSVVVIKTNPLLKEAAADDSVE